MGMEINMSQKNAAVTRFFIGLFQGLILYGLYFLKTHGIFPTTIPSVFVILSMIFLFLPLIVTQGLTNIHAKTLFIWSACAVIVLICLSYYDVWRSDPTYSFQSFTPSFTLFFSTIIMFFITHALITAGDKDSSVLARYTTYFDVSWKMVIQALLSLIFLSLFWMLLTLGQSLLSTVKLYFLEHLMNTSWFTTIASTMIIHLGLHVTDVNVNLVRGIRTTILTMLSWLLPLLTLLLVGFLIGLVHSGFSTPKEELAFLLQSLIFWLILLINATYQDGRPLSRFLHYTCALAMILLTLPVALSVYRLGFEISHTGWLTKYIWETALLLIEIFYALGYVYAAFSLKRIEKCNIFASIFTVIILLLLSTPIVEVFSRAPLS